MKNVKKLLSAHSQEILPDEQVKARIKSDLGFNRPTVPARSRRRAVFASVCAVCACALALCIILPVAFMKGKAPSLPGTTDNKFEAINDAGSFYVYGAASVGTLLSAQSASSGVLLSAQSASEITLSYGIKTAQAQNGEPQLGWVQKYMPLVESLLSEDNFSGSATDGYGEYQFGVIIECPDMLGGKTSYTMYYNKTFLESETDDDETEETYSIDGILCVGGAEYPVEGSYETETSSDESESELYFKAYTGEDRSSFIEVTQEFETESEDGKDETEKEYVYSIFDNGELTEKTVVEYEKEDDELELKMTVEKNGATDELIFRETAEQGERVLQVSGKVNGRDMRFRIYVRQGQYHYVFEDGSSSDYDRHEHGRN